MGVGYAKAVGKQLAVSLFLYVVHFALASYLRWGLNETDRLFMEEAGSAFLNVVFFDRGLQANSVGTNIGSYLLFWLGWKTLPFESIFYARLVKSIVMAFTPVFLQLLLHRRMHWTLPHSTLSAIAVSFAPGVVFYSVLGVDMAMDLPFGILALYLALGSWAASWFAGGLVGMFAALCYGSGLAFGPALLLALWPGRWRSIGIAGLGACVPLAASIAYWKNIQVLFLGGSNGGGYIKDAIVTLAYDTFYRGGSYYFPFPERNALGIFPATVVVGLLALLSLPHWREHRILIAVAAGSCFIGIVSGLSHGVRRSIPMIAIMMVLALVPVFKAPRMLQLLFVALLLISSPAGTVLLERDLRRVAITEADLPMLLNSPGHEESMENFRLGLAKLGEFEKPAHIRFALSVIYLVGGGESQLSFDKLLRVEDPMDEFLPMFPPEAPRFSMWRQQARRLLHPLPRKGDPKAPIF
jgi:hypothetical protein